MIVLLLHKSEVKPRTSVNNKDVIYNRIATLA